MHSEAEQERIHTHIVIRQASIDDAPQVARLIRESYQRAARDGGFAFTATNQTDEETRQFIENNRTIVAVSTDGTIVGTITLYPPNQAPNDPEILRGDDIAEFGLFARDNSVSGTDVGFQLLHHVEELTKANGNRRLFGVTAKDSPLHAYYHKLGFSEEVPVESSHDFALIALVKSL